jgi:PPM family protein phosphatase
MSMRATLSGDVTIAVEGLVPRLIDLEERSRMHSPQAPAARLAAWFMRRTAPSAVRRVAPLKAAVASDIGVAREENQDRVALVRAAERGGSPFIVAALADGIGGMKQGAECAALTLATFFDCVVDEAQHSREPAEWLRRGAERANRAVHVRQGGDGGSTLAAILMAKGHRPLWLSIGDSRVYHAADGKLTQLSRDDTLEGQLGKAIDGGRRSELLQFIGLGEGLEPHVEPVPWDLSGTLLLTTDGVHFVDADHLGKVVHFAPDLGQCARRLTETAKWLGGPDNASVAAIGVDGLAVEPNAQLDWGFEVWDPFGELQVIFDRGLRRYPSAAPAPTTQAAVASSAPLKPSPAGGGQEPGGDEKVASETQGGAGKAKTSKARGKSSRKTKAAKESEPDRQEEPGPEVPQLRIEFPNKPS